MRSWLSAVALAAIAILMAPAPARAAGSGNVVVQWYTSAIVQMTLTPNYASGFGAVPAVFGTQPAPTYGPGACPGGCAVDFGGVQAGKQYLYKYAAHINVQTNDTSGFKVYGEGAANFESVNSTGNSMTLSQTLYYVPSVASGDTNTGFSAGYPFDVTSPANSVNPSSPSASTPPTISYSIYPSPIFTSSAANGDIYQDYEMKIPATANADDYYVWIVYTVVAS